MDQPAIRDIAFNNTNIVWITEDSIYKMFKGATTAETPELVASVAQGDLVNVAAPDVYAVVSDRADNTVKRITLGTGTSVVVASSQGEPTGLIGGTETIYWTNRASGEVMRLDGWVSIE